MDKIFLFTRPDHDDTTHYLFAWCQEPIEFASKNGHKVLDLQLEKANRNEFEKILKRFSPNLMILNGHGSGSAVGGHKKEPILVAGENENLAKSKHIYAISCSSAKELGPKTIAAGAISYTGFDDEFVFFYEYANFSRPLQDETAKLFLKPFQTFIVSLMKGHSIEEARKKTQKLLRDNILKLLGTNNPDSDLVRYLWWDLRHFVSHGETSTSI